MRPMYIFWLCWFIAPMLLFCGAEAYGLATGKQRTLSEAVWALEKFVPRQPIGQWSAEHFLFCGVWLLAGFIWVWLAGHFLFGWWR